jgi:hypothetical protein
MHNFIKSTLFVSVLSAAVSGAAQADVYFEAGVSNISVDVDGDNINHYGAIGVIGTTLGRNGNISHKVEGIVGFGLNSDNIGGFEVKLESYFGAAYRPTIKLNDSVELHARAGLFNGRAKVSGFGFSETDSSTEAGFGVGIDFNMISLSYLRVDDTNFVNATYRF